MRILAALFFLLFLSLSLTGQGRANIIVVLVDDMGYSDLGSFGGEVRTPHLDRLAKNGLRLLKITIPPVVVPLEPHF